MKPYIILFFSCIVSLGYGQKIDEVFKTMPEELLPAFSEANKTMLLVDSSLSVIPYPLGEIEKLDYDETFLSLKTSEVGTMQIKLLSLVNQTQIIALIKTVCGTFCDSNIRFFSTDWNEIDRSSLLPQIKPIAFFDATQVNTEEFKWAISHIDIFPLQYQFEKESDNIIVTFDFKKSLSKNDLQKVTPYLENETIELSWNKSTFIIN